MGVVRCTCKVSSDRPAITTSPWLFPRRLRGHAAHPRAQSGHLALCGDDGGEHGQASLALRSGGAQLLFRVPCPRSDRRFRPAWTSPSRVFLARSRRGAPTGRSTSRPTLREIAEPDGTRYAVLDLNVEVPVTPLPDPSRCSAFWLGLGSQDAGHGDSAGPWGNRLLPRSSWIPAASTGDKPTPGATSID